MRGRTWPAYAAAAWGVLFALVHLYWALGGRAGLPGALTPAERYSWLLYEPYWLLGGILFVLTALSGRSTSDP